VQAWLSVRISANVIHYVNKAKRRNVIALIAKRKRKRKYFIKSNTFS
jgi:hypothetical protein